MNVRGALASIVLLTLPQSLESAAVLRVEDVRIATSSAQSVLSISTVQNLLPAPTHNMRTSPLSAPSQVP